ncbi:MAG: PHP domain-containing protein [Planctomycetes bacterium]|nr:PHP domain-containing protein [Planctomycetota bacterium]
MSVDLHLHSNISDGLYPPDEVFNKVRNAGLKIIALTDHDSYSGGERLKQQNANDGIKVIQGIEISSSYEGTEIHVLGYFRDGLSEELKSFVATAQADRESRISKGLANLEKKGINLTRVELGRFYHGESIGRNHLAQLLVEKGYADSPVDAFQSYLKYDLNIVPQTTTKIADVIGLVKNSGGVCIWAHPPMKFFDKYIAVFVSMGMDGVEAYNRRKSNNNSFYYHTVAEKLDLLITAGSDWHGFPEEEFMSEKIYPAQTLDKFMEKIL